MKVIKNKYKKGQMITLDDLMLSLNRIDNSFINFDDIRKKISELGDSLICLRDIEIIIKFDDKIDLSKESEKLENNWGIYDDN